MPKSAVGSDPVVMTQAVQQGTVYSASTPFVSAANRTVTGVGAMSDVDAGNANNTLHVWLEHSFDNGLTWQAGANAVWSGGKSTLAPVGGLSDFTGVLKWQLKGNLSL